MKRRISIQFKAAFLIIVFSLNTVIGFACAVGLDMGFNSKHHDEGNATEAIVHIHKDGKKHIHHEKKEKHDQAKNHHKAKDKNNCCNDKVINFEQLDKSVPHSFSIVHPVFFTAFVAVYGYINSLPHTDIVRDIKPFVRSYHPPISDIRIGIRSFQI